MTTPRTDSIPIDGRCLYAEGHVRRPRIRPASNPARTSSYLKSPHATSRRSCCAAFARCRTWR